MFLSFHPTSDNHIFICKFVNYISIVNYMSQYERISHFFGNFLYNVKFYSSFFLQG